MKKSTKLMVALLVIVAALAVTYRLMNRVPSADLEANAQMQQIITDAGCLRCHTSNPDLPFYANMPVAGKIVMEDVSKAYRAFDMTRMAADLKAGNPVDQVALAKVEKVILDGKMPQPKYYLVHWGASISDTKKELVLNWVKNHRMGLMGDANVAPEFINEPIRPIADSISVDVRKVLLGDMLYHDTRLSADNTVSCASCHGLDMGGVDNKQYSEGVGGQLGGVHTNREFLKKTLHFLDTPNDMYQGSLTVEKRNDCQYEVEFRDVSFCYPGTDRKVLEHVNLKFRIGEKLAIVGENGS